MAKPQMLNEPDSAVNKTVFQAWRFIVNRGLVVALLLMVILFSITSSTFLTFGNVINIFQQIAIESLIAVPMTMVIVLGEIDLSVGAVVGLAGSMLGNLVVNQHFPLWPAIVITLFAGAVVGLLNGVITTRLKIPSFIVTLATMTSIQGISLEFTQGYPISGFPNSFSFWGQGFVGPIPVPVIFLVVFYSIGHIVMSKTSFGREIYAIGGNAEAARLSGIRVRRVKVTVLCLTGLTAAVSGILLASRLTSGIANSGDSYMLDVVAGVIIGGTNLFGGEGDIVGTFLGILFMGVLANGLILVGVSPFMHYIVQGLVVLFAVALNTLKHRGNMGG